MRKQMMTVLDQLLTHEDILACMIVHQNQDTIMPTKKDFEPEVNNLIEHVEQVKDLVFKIMGEYAKVGLYKQVYRFQDHEVWFYVNPQKAEYALVAVFPTLANKEIVSVELEKGWQQVQKVYG